MNNVQFDYEKCFIGSKAYTYIKDIIKKSQKANNFEAIMAPINTFELHSAIFPKVLSFQKTKSTWPECS